MHVHNGRVVRQIAGMVTFLAACLLATGIATRGFAQQIDVDALAKTPGFTVTKKIEKGEEIVEIRKATVVIRMSRGGIIGTDSDIAIQCAWQIYADLKVVADFCYPESELELKEDLTAAVEDLKSFIVANSLTPVARKDLDAWVQTRAQKLAGRPRTEATTTYCRDHLGDFQKDGREKRRADVAKMLAVPRPPVMNPCL